MVGNETGDRYQRGNRSIICCPSSSRGVCPARASFLKCLHSALEGKPCPYDGNPEDQIASEASAEARLYDAETSGAISYEGEKGAALGEVLFNRMVYRLPTFSDYWP